MSVLHSQAHQAKSGCRFCLGNELLDDAPLFANDTCYFLSSADPILVQAGMIIPFRHSISPFELNEAEWRDTHDLLNRAKLHLRADNPAGFNIGWNVGSVAGQTVLHNHLHIIARFSDEPMAGRGIRHWLKQPSNKRQSL